MIFILRDFYYNEYMTLLDDLEKTKTYVSFF